MIREILKMGDERLLRIAQPVPSELFGSEELQRLIDDMFETMHHVGGVGLAAPQIGVDLQLVIFGFERSERYPDAPAVPPTILLNPRITLLDDEMEEGWEGCLSVPGLRGAVSRHRRIRYQGLDPQGQPIDRSVEGFHARVVQHECDHLIGRLYPSRITTSASSASPRCCSPTWTPPRTIERLRLRLCSGLAQLRGGVPSGAVGACFFARFARRFSWAVFSGFLRVSFFAFSPLLMAFTSPRSTCVRAGWPMASAAPDGGGRFQHNAWRSARRGRRSTALSATGVVR